MELSQSCRKIRKEKAEGIMGTTPSITDHPPIDPGKGDSGLKQAGVYVAAGVVGLGAGVNELHHEFYRESKEWAALKDPRKARREAIDTAGDEVRDSGLPMEKRYALRRDKMNAIEKTYQDAVSEAMEERGIYSKDFLKKWTVGSWQRWDASGPHTRRSVVFNLLGTGVITLMGGLLAIRLNQGVGDAVGKPDPHQASKER